MRYLAIAISLFVVFLTTNLEAQTLDAKQLFNKKLVKVQKKEVNVTENFYGDIVIPEDAIKDVNLRFSGYVGKVNKNKTYLFVNKGDKLFDIYSDEINLTMNEFLLRDRNLRQNYISKLKSYAIDDKEIDKLEKTRKVSEYIDIYSQYKGFILSKNITDGSFVQKGKSLFQIADFSKLWVIANVYQKDLKLLKDGLEAKIYIDGLGVKTSKVDFIYPNINTKDKTVKVRFIVDNHDFKIYPNMFAKVSLKIVSKTTLVLPKTAVLTKANKHYVFIPDGDMYEPKEVTAIRINSNEFEIVGLNEGDVVIDKAMFLLDSDAITNGLYNQDSKDEDW